jgi:trichothecene 3-O-acetyltransferase
MGFTYDTKVETPVFFIQANFVRGGLLLCFASMHNAIDMNGQGVLIRQFAALMRGEELDPKLVAEGNQDANSIVPLLKNGEIPLEHAEMRKPSHLNPVNGAAAAPPSQTPKAKWTYWRFPSPKLAELKKLASANPKARVSTNDAITALYTQRLTAMRIAAGRLSRDESIHCLRAADGRARLNPPVPNGYLGHLVGLAYTEWPAAGSVLDSHLSTVASDIRDSLDKVDDYNIRSLATLIHTTEDKTTIFYGAKKKLGKDIFISSWAQMDLARTCDFGEVLKKGGKDGRPDFVRRATMDIVPDLTYIMPKNREGDMAIGGCLFEEDIEGLEADEVWKKYTRMIG